VPVGGPETMSAAWPFCAIKPNASANGRKILDFICPKRFVSGNNPTGKTKVQS